MPKSAGISPTFLPKPMAQNPLSHRCICFHPDFWYASASSSRHYGIYYSKCIPYMLHCAGPASPWKRPTKHDLPHPTVQDDITLRLFSVGRLHHSNTSGKSTLQFQPVPVREHRFHSPCGIPRCFRCHTECAFPWFRLTLNVMSYKCNSSQRKHLIISSLCVDVTSDEFLWKIFPLLFHVMINAFGLCYVSYRLFFSFHAKAYLLSAERCPFDTRKMTFYKVKCC